MQPLTRTMAVRGVDKLCRYIPAPDELYRAKMVYGLETFIINTTKLTIIFAASAWLGLLLQTAAVMLGYILIRRWSFGLHAKHSAVCTVVSLSVFVLAPYLLAGAEIRQLLIVVIFATLVVLLGLYAPADTEARPLLDPENRQRLRRKAVVAGLVIMAVALAMPCQHTALLITFGACFQIITILPITYKILKRRNKNYETYE